MGRIIVICSDGTGSTLETDTNVIRLARFLDLDDTARQVACYDPGLGTIDPRSDETGGYERGPADPELTVLSGPPASRIPLLNKGRQLAGLGFGYGLKDNVFQLYAHLASVYRGPEDRVFLFGFSRGAFTVRALAGLLHRCQLTSVTDPRQLARRFEAAWVAYQPMHPHGRTVMAALEDTRRCMVHFLGLWDTVKSYGGLIPVMLPHLRHNPAVAHVRHGLALDERRAWFKHTTWGRLDADEAGALTRIPPTDLKRIRDQDIAEVWFTGAHGDIGSGDITLRWMMTEATRVKPGLVLNQAGTDFLAEADRAPGITSVWDQWRRVEQVPRLEIDNSGKWPRRRYHRGSDGLRDPYLSRRGGKVIIHPTVTATRLPSIDIEVFQQGRREE